MKPAAVIAILLLSGCASGPGTKWYAPATWFSHAPANAVDAANKKESEAEQAAIRLAQRKTHETQIALAAADDSRPVQLAVDANDTAVSLLDQTSPFPASELTTLRKTYAGLFSEDAKVRKDAEKEHAREDKDIEPVSTRLAKARAATDAAERNLRVAFDRENALANELRSARALHWILGTLAVLAMAAWLYVRYFLGGIPGAVGSMMARIETSHPDMAKVLREQLDAATNRHEQRMIRNEYLKAK